MENPSEPEVRMTGIDAAASVTARDTVMSTFISSFFPSLSKMKEDFEGIGKYALTPVAVSCGPGVQSSESEQPVRDIAVRTPIIRYDLYLYGFIGRSVLLVLLLFCPDLIEFSYRGVRIQDAAFVVVVLGLRNA